MMADDNTIGSSEQEVFMLTTVDNPFNPFTEWAEWFAYDEKLGYHTCALLARVTATSDELSDVDQDQTVQQAIDEVVQYNVSGMHRKVSRSFFESVE
jgi:hypothetical protein